MKNKNNLNLINLIISLIGIIIIISLSVYFTWAYYKKIEFKSDLLNENGNLTLYVGNQSYDKPNIDIEIFLNEKKIVDHNFRNIDQHQRKVFQYQVNNGHFILIIKTETGNAELKKEFDLSGKLWVIISYNDTKENENPLNIEFHKTDIMFL